MYPWDGPVIGVLAFSLERTAIESWDDPTVTFFLGECWPSANDTVMIVPLRKVGQYAQRRSRARNVERARKECRSSEAKVLKLLDLGQLPEACRRAQFFAAAVFRMD